MTGRQSLAAALAVLDVVRMPEGQPLDLSPLRVRIDPSTGEADATDLLVGAGAAVTYLAAELATMTGRSVEDVLSDAQWNLRLEMLPAAEAT